MAGLPNLPFNPYQYFQRPEVLLLIVPLVLLLIYFLKKDFVFIKEDLMMKKKRKRVQNIMIFTRFLIFLSLLTAVASPYFMTEKIIAGDPVLKILVDNSSSMQMLSGFDHSIIDRLKNKVEVEVVNIGSKDTSDIGDGILHNIGPYESVLLVSDANANKGASLGDVALFASRLNATINAVSLKPKSDDVGISILGPSKVMGGVETILRIRLNRVGSIKDVPVTIALDNEVIYSQATSEDVIEIKRTFAGGMHKLIAKTGLDDHFKENNIFYKTLKVVPRPRLLFYSIKPESPLLSLLSGLYDVEALSTLPDPDVAKSYFKDFYAVIINDVPAGELDSKVQMLGDYLIEGNGMLVVGGENSFNKGRYKNSKFEHLLPVFSSRPDRKDGETNIVIVIDISGSTGGGFAGAKAVDVEKAMAIDVTKQLSKKDKVGVVAFNTQAYPVSELAYLFEKSDLEERIARLKDGGGTLIGAGLMGAINMLKYSKGSKNIILISDGRTQASNAATEAAKLASNEGIKIYTVGVGDETNDATMLEYADLTGGVYFRAEGLQKINLLFGDVDETQQTDSDNPGLVILDENHFITENIPDIKASVSGWNEIVPKTTAKMLVATSNAMPMLNVWRFGLGRVAALGTDDGTAWGGQLLSSGSSALLVRTINWIVSEPDRKAKERIDIPDTRVFEPARVLIKAEQQPKAEGLGLYKIDQNTYETTITPTSTGFQEVLDATFASNYPVEYEFLGINPDLKKVVESTEGKFFESSDIKGIVDAVKSKTQRSIRKEEAVRWPFVIIAIVIFLVEIFIRRWLRKE